MLIISKIYINRGTLNRQLLSIRDKVLEINTKAVRIYSYLLV